MEPNKPGLHVAQAKGIIYRVMLNSAQHAKRGNKRQK
jgi:hypothetical protein